MEDKVVKEITNYLKVPSKQFNLKCHLTTAYIMPYDFKDKWFMIPTHKNLAQQIECVIHELFHLYHTDKKPITSFQEREEEVEKFIKTYNATGLV